MYRDARSTKHKIWKIVDVIACRVKNKMLLVEVSNERPANLLPQSLLQLTALKLMLIVNISH